MSARDDEEGGSRWIDPRPRRSARLTIAAVLSVLMTLSGSRAASRSTAAPCTPDGGETVRVAAVADDFSVSLDDGRTLRLAGIDPVASTAAQPTRPAEARKTLMAWLGHRDAVLRRLAATPDRWGRFPALLFAAAAPPAPHAETVPNPAAASALLSVALAMVDAGLARARPDPETQACWPALLGAEAGAREAGLGLWDDPYYAVRDAADEASLAAVMGSMAIVQGRISGVGQGRSRLFLRLGAKGTDFTLRLSRRDSFILADLGLSETRLSGLDVRVRGFLDDRFGPAIDITSADQIEVLGRATGSGRSQGPEPSSDSRARVEPPD